MRRRSASPAAPESRRLSPSFILPRSNAANATVHGANVPGVSTFRSLLSSPVSSPVRRRRQVVP